MINILIGTLTRKFMQAERTQINKVQIKRKKGKKEEEKKMVEHRDTQTDRHTGRRWLVIMAQHFQVSICLSISPSP